MRKIAIAIRALAVQCAVFTVMSASAEEPRLECANINCDCSALGSAIVKETCDVRQKELRSECHKLGLNAASICSYSGAKNNRGLQVLTSDASAQLNRTRIEILGKQWSVMHDAFVLGFARLEKNNAAQNNLNLAADLEKMQMSVEEMLKIQRKLAQAFAQSESDDAMLKSWEQFANFMIDTATSLHNAAKHLETQQSKANEKLTELEAVLYEQAGYGLDRATEFGLASKYWKKAADAMSVLVIAADTNGETKLGDKYRYMRSTQLHRARESWNKRKNALIN